MPPLSPSQTISLLTQLEHRAKKKLGQNFLIDQNIVRKSIELAGLPPQATVVEVGPGLGTLSQTLIDAGAELHAVEIDPTLALHLRNAFAGILNKQFFLTEGDAMDFPLGDLTGKALSTEFSIVANLPYAITSPWIEKVLSGKLPQRMVLMMQKEAAQRLSATPESGQMSAVSIFLQAAYKETQSHRVSRHCFYPQPKVDSILVRYDLKENPFTFSRSQKDKIRQIFTQRRKQIGTLLKNDSPYTQWVDSLPQFNCTSQSRPEAIPLNAWLTFP